MRFAKFVKMASEVVWGEMGFQRNCFFFVFIDDHVSTSMPSSRTFICLSIYFGSLSYGSSRTFFVVEAIISSSIRIVHRFRKIFCPERTFHVRSKLRGIELNSKKKKKKELRETPQEMLRRINLIVERIRGNP